jgi:hypothetical protein
MAQLRQKRNINSYGTGKAMAEVESHGQGLLAQK